MELSQYANYELGEAFYELTGKMIMQDGIPFSKIGDFEIVSPSWRKLADKENKTPEEIKKLDDDYKMEVCDLADSCAIFISAKTGNKSYKFSFEDYKKFAKSVNLIHVSSDKADIDKYNLYIENRFKKIANHGEASGDNIIDNKDIAAYIYALDLKTIHGDNNEFKGFNLNGKITPLDYALAYRQLRESDENMISIKLRNGYKNLFL